MGPEELLREGRLDEALKQLQQQVRSQPSKAELRMFLFQLLSLRGDWKRAITQLNVAAELDAEKILVAQICRPALNCEALRAEIFAGRRSPLVFGEPPEWIGSLIQANQMLADGKDGAALELRDRAFEAAPAVGGMLDGQPFEWIADADTRLGPVLEAIIDGKYFWVPMERLRTVRIDKPVALRNLVWAEAQFVFANNGQSPGLIPTRYAGSEASDDPSIRLAKRTQWTQRGGHALGLGQRMLATDRAELPLLEVRQVVFTGAGAPAGEPPGAEPAQG